MARRHRVQAMQSRNGTNQDQTAKRCCLAEKRRFAILLLA